MQQIPGQGASVKARSSARLRSAPAMEHVAAGVQARLRAARSRLLPPRIPSPGRLFLRLLLLGRLPLLPFPVHLLHQADVLLHGVRLGHVVQALPRVVLGPVRALPRLGPVAGGLARGGALEQAVKGEPLLLVGHLVLVALHVRRGRLEFDAGEALVLVEGHALDRPGERERGLQPFLGLQAARRRVAGLDLDEHRARQVERPRARARQRFITILLPTLASAT